MTATRVRTPAAWRVLPVRRITPAIIEETMERVMRPMAKAMVAEGVPFTGFCTAADADGRRRQDDRVQRTLWRSGGRGHPAASEERSGRIHPAGMEQFVYCNGAIIKIGRRAGIGWLSGRPKVLRIRGSISWSDRTMGTAIRDGELVTDGAADRRQRRRRWKKRMPAYAEVKVDCDRLFIVRTSAERI
ncbi:MAG: hypothetical protein ACLVJ6_13235 [Merdibacter sp.]